MRVSQRGLTVDGAGVSPDELASSCTASKEQQVKGIRFFNELGFADLLRAPEFFEPWRFELELDALGDVEVGFYDEEPLLGVLAVGSFEPEDPVTTLDADREMLAVGDEEEGALTLRGCLTSPYQPRTGGS